MGFPPDTSYGGKPYAEKREHYFGQNLLAQSLYETAYDHNPGFRKFREESGLRFRPHTEFKKADLDARQKLYQEMADAPVSDPVAVWREFCSEAGIRHDGGMKQPPATQGELW